MPPSTSKHDRSEQGQRFEAEIAEIYSAMGYRVFRHVPVSGQEVDIIAERHVPGAGPYRVMVECKYKGGNSFAGNADVQAIAGAYQIARSNHQVSACTLVSTNGFSLQAQEAASAAGIRTVTKRELIKGLLDLSSYQRTLQTEFIRDFGEGAENWCVPAHAQQGGSDPAQLIDVVDAWRSRKQKRPLAILGGYGTGKTTFCRHYANQVLERSDPILPVIISLRDFRKATKIESLIRDFLDEHCNVGAPRFDAFWRMYEEGLILLMFDGFDEMASRTDSSVLELNLAEIEKFARPPANLILTCRPELFVTQTEELRALEPSLDAFSLRQAEYERIHIALWTPAQVSEFVYKRVTAMHLPAEHSPEFYLEQIDRLPELRDTSFRPVHLDLIVRMLPQMVEQNISITRTNIYRTYLEREMRRETVQNRRLRIISDDDRLALIREIAAESFLKNQSSLDFHSAASLVKRVLYLPRSEVDVVTRDLLNRSFLSRSGDEYEFAHKSLGEYLFATYIFEELLQHRSRFLDQSPASVAVSGMVLELFGGIVNWGDMIRAMGVPADKELEIDDLPAIMFSVFGFRDYIDQLNLQARTAESPPEASLFLGLLHNAGNLIHVIMGNYEMFRENIVDNDSMTNTMRSIWPQLFPIISMLQDLEH